MEFNNSHIQKFVENNAPKKIRNRAMEILVLETEYDEVNETVNSIAIGSQEYHVSIKNYKSSNINALCTCPYDYGKVCKHIVAVAKHVDEHLGVPIENTFQKTSNQSQTKQSLYKFDSSSSTYSFTKSFIRNLDYDTILKITTKGLYSQSRNVQINHSHYDDQKSTLHLSLLSDYWSSTVYQNTIHFDDNHVHIQTNCQCQKTRVCKHVIYSLEYIIDNYFQLILTKQELKKEKQKVLNEYGFSLEDETYKKYFEFVFTSDGVDLKHKVKGIVSTENVKMLADFKEAVISSDELTSSYLPKPIKKSKIKKEFKIALGVHFSDDFTDVFSKPIIGFTDKDGNISTGIKYLDHKTFIEKQSEFSDQDTELIKLTYKKLSLEDRNPKEQGYFSSKITALHELINKANLVKTPFFEIIDFHNPRLYKRDLSPIELQINNGELSIEVCEKDVFIETNAYLKLNRKKKVNSYQTKKYYLFAKEENTYYLHPNKNICDVIHFFTQAPSFKVLQKDFKEFQKNILHPLEEKFPVTYLSLPKRNKQKQTEGNIQKQLYLSQLEDHILLKPALNYSGQITPLYSNKKVILKKENTEIEIARNQELENIFDNEVRGLHSKFQYQNNEFFFLSESELIENEWFLNFYEKTTELGIEVFGRNDLKLKYNKNKASIAININSGIDWFDVNVEVSFGDQKVSLKDLKKNIINKDKYIALKDGSIGILPEEWLEKYFSIFKSGTLSKDGVKVSKYNFSAVDTLYENYQNETNLFEEHLKIKEKLNNFSTISDVRQPRGINAKLRPYQKEGLKWLNFLDDFNLGGCLADDMGLGKTLQTITFLKHIKTKRKPKNAHLIVVPTSLIFNWNEEVQKFCPELKVYTHTGLKRTQDTTTFNNYDIVLTTYGLIINDSKLLNSYTFHYIILDESQAIKNPNSKRYKSIKVLKGKNRLVMTGTPIENNTFDLFAQMNFINPGLLGGIQQFRSEYANAIDKNNDVKVAEELRQIIHPFLMRRTKAQVITDLPPKTEQVLYCEMGKEQRKVYDALKNEYRDYVMGKIDTEGFEKSQMYILEALIKLRQVCNSPSLVNDDQDYTNESVKIDMLLEDVIEKTGNHKILVFSQFTSMLSLIKKRLEKHSINYEYLDGSTRNRQAKVDNFQTNEDIRIFLISLKAGGTGLNLTAADYVYIVDPWWNPAAEAQAIDRCYRIGQNKKVMAYKMICKDSIEEKIIQLQNNKKQVSNDLIQTEKSFVKQLTKNSLQDLFQ